MIQFRRLDFTGRFYDSGKKTKYLLSTFKQDLFPPFTYGRLLAYDRVMIDPQLQSWDPSSYDRITGSELWYHLSGFRKIINGM